MGMTPVGVSWKRKSPGTANCAVPGQLTQVLLDFDLGASFFQLLLGGFGVSLGHSFLDGLRSAVDQVLGFLQTQTGQLAHGLDDADLVRAGFLQDDGELGLLFSSGSSATSGGSSDSDGSGSSRHAEL